jgi:hypothetical protein
MAHFAQLDTTNKVINVIVINNDDILDENGIENEAIGIQKCKFLFGQNSNWAQTSYNNNMRVRYAGIGFTYDETLDAFIQPKPYPSWIINEETVTWEAPVPMPTDAPEESYYQWNEELVNWELITPPEPVGVTTT